MYDAREKAIRDQQWILNSVDRAYQKGEREGEIKGKIEGEIKLIRPLQGILGEPVAEEQELREMNSEQLEAMTSGLQVKLRNRMPSV